MLAIFMEACTDSVAFSIYTLAESCTIADLVTDAQQLAVSNARATSSMGVAQVTANLLGGTIAAMNPRLPFVLGATMCLGSACVVAFGVRETSSKAQPQTQCPGPAEGAPKEEHRGSGGPLALLCSGRSLRVLTLSALVDSMVDKTFQIRAIHATQHVGMSSAQFGLYSAGRGLVRMFSGYATAIMLRLTGACRGTPI